MSLQKGDILICKKDYKCTYVNAFRCKVGDTVKIEQIDSHDVASVNVVFGYYIVNSDDIGTWVYIKLDGWAQGIKYAWTHFMTLKGRSNRMRKITEELCN